MSDSCNPMNCSLPGSYVHGILQARILEWFAISFSRIFFIKYVCVFSKLLFDNSAFPRCKTAGFLIKSILIQVLTNSVQHRLNMFNSQGEKYLCVNAQLCLTLCNPMNCSLPGSYIHGIVQARILEWVAISFSRRSSQPRNRTQVPHIAGRLLTVWATGEVLRG